MCLTHKKCGDKSTIEITCLYSLSDSRVVFEKLHSRDNKIKSYKILTLVIIYSGKISRQ